jgi:hypothetical protein
MQCCQMVKQKIPTLVNLGRSWDGRCWYLYVHFAYLTAKWYIL